MEIFTYLVFAWFFIHFIECLIYKNHIAKSPHGKIKATIYTMLFGVLYLRRIKPKN